MTVRYFINRRIGLSTDIKPNIRATPIFHETDTGYTYNSNVTDDGYQLHSGSIRTEELQNKTIDTETNLVTVLLEDSPFASGGQSKGGIVPAATVPDSFYGSLEGTELFNPKRIVDDLTVTNAIGTDGMLVEFYGGSTVKAGFASQFPVARREHNYTLKAEIKSTSRRPLVGFSSTQILPTNTNVFGTTDVGVVIGFTESSSKFSVFCNAGTGTVTTPVAFTKDKDAEMHTYEIILGPTNIVCKLDGEAITLSTNIPSLTVPLYTVAYGTG